MIVLMIVTPIILIDHTIYLNTKVYYEQMYTTGYYFKATESVNSQHYAQSQKYASSDSIQRLTICAFICN